MIALESSCVFLEGTRQKPKIEEQMIGQPCMGGCKSVTIAQTFWLTGNRYASFHNIYYVQIKYFGIAHDTVMKTKPTPTDWETKE